MAAPSKEVATPQDVTTDLEPNLFKHALTERNETVREYLEQLREMSAHLVTEVTVHPDGNFDVNARMPKEGEVPSFTVRDESPTRLEQLLGMHESAESYAEQATRPVPETLHRRNEQLKDDASLLAEGLGGSPLAKAVAQAFARRSDEMLTLAQQVRASHDKRVTIEEVTLAQRDLFFLQQAAIQALGVRSIEEGYEASNTYTRPVGYASTNRKHNAYIFRYEVHTTTFDYEGDYDDLPDEDWPEGTPYSGTLEIEVDPAKRISFSYTPKLENARARHATSDVKQREHKLVAHDFASLNMRIDFDEYSPAGVALDFGRSEYESATFIRDSDLLGKVMHAINPEHGSHTYDEFTPDMREQLTPMAERLSVRLALGMKEYESSREADDTSLKRFRSQRLGWRAVREEVARVRSDGS